MKSTINAAENLNHVFPKLMISNNNKIIIIATEIIDGNIKGMVINDDTWPLGYSSNGWIINNFKDFKGKIVLEND